MSLYPERETNVESVSERGTVDISRNSLNPFHVSFHITLKQFHAKLTLLPRKTHAKSTLIPRKIHGKKSRDMRDSTFVSVRDINITLTVLYYSISRQPTFPQKNIGKVGLSAVSEIIGCTQYPSRHMT